MKKGFLAFSACILVTFCMVAPVSGTSVGAAQSRLGTWLYVGGSGPGNYTTIQDALNASVDGDTVYVYDDSSPYRESITITHTISLIGEDMQTTVINGSGLSGPYVWPNDIVTIHADNVVMHDFTLIDSELTGLVIRSNNNTISQLVIENSGTHGIFMSSGSDSIVLQGNIIKGCTFSNNNNGIYAFIAIGTTIKGNIVQGNYNGLLLFDVFQSNISSNTISANTNGISTFYCCNNLFSKNTITGNTIGMNIQFSKDSVRQNNFLSNGQHVSFLTAPVFEIIAKISVLRNQSWAYFFHDFQALGNTRWLGNYWDKPRLLPYPIVGVQGILYLGLVDAGEFIPNRVTFDWLPALHPY